MQRKISANWGKTLRPLAVAQPQPHTIRNAISPVFINKIFVEINY
jgi:hypothetical protein